MRWTVLPLIVLAVALRLVHLDADPVADFIPKDEGYQVDEGYKTLSPRNLVLFGATHWSEFDDYGGWMQDSPVTQWAYYASFSEFGTNRVSARSVTVVFFALFLLGAAAFFQSRYAAGVTLMGMVLLACDQALFHFSRVAILEIPLAAFVYGGIFIAARCTRDHAYLALLALVFVAGVAAFGIKMSALIYLVPAIVALSAAEVLRGSRVSVKPQAYLLMALGVLAIAAILVLWPDWVSRVDWHRPFREPNRLFLQQMYQLSPLALSLASLALIDIGLRHGVAAFRDNRYLLLVASTAFIAPVMLAFATYNPPRYYVVVVPALLLIVVEWLHLWRAGALKDPYHFSMGRLFFAGIISLLLAVSIVDFGSEYLIPSLAFIPQGDYPGLGTTTKMILYLVVLVGFWVFVWSLWRHRIRARILSFALVAGIALHLGFSARSIAEAVLHSSYAGSEITRKLELIVAEGESVAGDWAPFLALDTRIPALYTTDGVNDSGQIELVRPTYFLDSHTVSDRKMMEQLQKRPGEKHEPIHLGNLFGLPVELVKIDYPSGH